ncbi:hypothetical protein BKA62DRAFT_805045 [Auriculariales sp. MPI-PUGE-AT-0066]|nr:hypothetical protein BKA62DRAFT_805045 [Auriculariales sp. MPI-PUGE-AT-0066]
MTFDRLPPGSWVLVTGATGFAGSAIVDLLLQKGFHVRGVGRSILKAAPFIKHLNVTYGVGCFEFAEVADFTISGAFGAALQGIVGVVHVATESSWDVLGADAEAALAAASATVLGLMKDAALTGSVKSFVLTSSAAAVVAGAVEYGRDVEFSTEIWQDQLIPLAKSLTAEAGFAKNIVAYAATKVHAEREAWKFWNETKPSYAFNSILPVNIYGPVANPTPGIVYTTHTWLNDLFLGNRESMIMRFINPAVAMVDNRDCAAIHVAALLSTEVNGQRLWASAHAFTANQILAVWRKAFPDRDIVADFDYPVHPKVHLTDVDKSTKLLKEFTGKDWYSFEQTMIANVADVI